MINLFNKPKHEGFIPNKPKHEGFTIVAIKKLTIYLWFHNQIILMVPIYWYLDYT